MTFRDKISGSHGGEYEDDRPDDGGSKHLWNVGKLTRLYGAIFQQTVIFDFSTIWSLHSLNGGERS
jgi:hypothetical protein